MVSEHAASVSGDERRRHEVVLTFEWTVSDDKTYYVLVGEVYLNAGPIFGVRLSLHGNLCSFENDSAAPRASKQIRNSVWYSANSVFLNIAYRPGGINFVPLPRNSVAVKFQLCQQEDKNSTTTTTWRWQIFIFNVRRTGWRRFDAVYALCVREFNCTCMYCIITLDLRLINTA